MFWKKAVIGLALAVMVGVVVMQAFWSEESGRFARLRGQIPILLFGDESSSPRPPVCGDGNRDVGEECDWGAECGYCSCETCTFPRCGNGVVEEMNGEECDPGGQCDDGGTTCTDHGDCPSGFCSPIETPECSAGCIDLTNRNCPGCPINSCALDIVLVMDISGSIGMEPPGSSQLDQMKQSLVEFVDEWGDIPVRFGLLAFNVQVFVLQDFTEDRDAIRSAINGVDNTERATNWGAPLRAALTMAIGHRPDVPVMIVFSSDGLPNTPNGEYFALAQAVEVAEEAIDEHNVRIVALGVGEEDDIKIENLEAIASPNPDPPPDKDAYLVPDFIPGFRDKLVEFIADNCSGRVFVQKFLDYEPSEGWEITVTDTTSIEPPYVETTLTSGIAEFDLSRIINPTTIDITEAPEPDTNLVEVFCRNRAGEPVGQFVTTGDLGVINVSFEQREVVVCTFMNETCPAGQRIVLESGYMMGCEEEDAQCATTPADEEPRHAVQISEFCIDEDETQSGQ